MKTKTLMMMTVAAAAIIAAPAFANGTKHHSKHAKTVSSTTVNDNTMAPAAGTTENSAPNVEPTQNSVNNRSDSTKASGVAGDPNTSDPSETPR